MMFVAIIVILLKWSEVSSVIVFLAGWVAYTPSLTENFKILWSPSIIYENGFGKKKIWYSQVYSILIHASI